MASIFAWSRGLAQRAKLDTNGRLAAFCTALEESVIDTIKKGYMTKDLALCVSGGKPVQRSQYQSTDEFMAKVADNFRLRL